jgi:hypothetical protein
VCFVEKFSHMHCELFNLLIKRDFYLSGGSIAPHARVGGGI